MPVADTALSPVRAMPWQGANGHREGWNYEGVAFWAPAHSSTPVWRLFNPRTGEHHYTTSGEERNALVEAGWKDEGIGWYADDDKGRAMWRLFNPKAAPVASHHFTSSEAERTTLLDAGWTNEGVGFYALS